MTSRTVMYILGASKSLRGLNRTIRVRPGMYVRHTVSRRGNHYRLVRPVYDPGRRKKPSCREYA